MILIKKFERLGERLMRRRDFAWRVVIFILWGFAIEAVTLLAGALGFYCIERLSWLDSVLNAAMIITGNGPTFRPKSDGAKVFQLLFSLAGVVSFILVLSVILVPVLHRILHRFHLKPDDAEKS